MTRRVLVYGDITPDIIDGSSIWLISITEVLSHVFDEVHLLLKTGAKTDVLVGRVAADKPNVHIHTPPLAPGSESAPDAFPVLDIPSAATVIQQLVTTLDITTVLARGFDLCYRLANEPIVAPRLWAYVTDIPFPLSRLSPRGLNRLRTIVLRSQLMFSQTEAARSYLEAIVPSASGKTRLMPPMVPDDAFELGTTRPQQVVPPLRLVYSGKFAKDWRVMEMLDLPDALAARGIETNLWILGSKFQKDRADPTWHKRMEQRLTQLSREPDSRVTWLGGVTREQSLSVMATCHVGLSWRNSNLDGSLEISTKALEYGAVGVAPIVNRTDDHVALYGSDYPLFSDSSMTVEHLADTIHQALPNLLNASHLAEKVSSAYSMRAARIRLKKYLDATVPRLPVAHSNSTRPTLRIAVASHDFKFMGEILHSLQADGRFEVKVDQWQTLHEHKEAVSKEMCAWADAVFCEWAGPNAVWYAANCRDNQRLIVRLHGFELRGPWLKHLNAERVDTFVVVSPLYRDRLVDVLSVPPEKVLVIPNAVDSDDLLRPKLSGSEYHLALIGWVSFGKRPDRALSLIQNLIAADNRYVLHIKGRMPWEYPHEWNDRIQRQLYLEFLATLASDSKLRQHVSFEGFSADIGSWLRKIGTVLSPSDFESFHLAPAEGMASGASAVVWPRAGAAEIFGTDRIFSCVEHASEFILSLRDPLIRDSEANNSIEWATRWDTVRVMRQWHDLLLQ